MSGNKNVIFDKNLKLFFPPSHQNMEGSESKCTLGKPNLVLIPPKKVEIQLFITENKMKNTKLRVDDLSF